MDNKRLVVAIGLCIGVLVVWTVLFPPAKQTPAPPPAPVAGQNAPAAPPAQPGTPAAPAAPAGTGTAAPGTAPVANRPEQLLELSTPEVRFVLSNQGGNLVHAKLREKQFLDKADDPASGHDVVRSTDNKDAAMRIEFPPPGIPTPADGAWEATQPSPESVVFATDVGDVHIEKRWRVDVARYRLRLDVVVSNRGQAAVGSKLLTSIGGRQDPDKRGGGFFSGVSASVSTALCYANTKVVRKPIQDLAEKPIKDDEGSGTINWVATDEKFF